MRNNIITTLLAALLGVVLTGESRAQSTAFTYQGRLNDNGAPANGSFDLTFTLYATNSAGTPVAGPITNAATAVSNGLFTAVIDFGAAVFEGGSNWLEIGITTNGGSNFTALFPRQQLTPAPNAIFALVAGTLVVSATNGIEVAGSQATGTNSIALGESSASEGGLALSGSDATGTNTFAATASTAADGGVAIGSSEASGAAVALNSSVAEGTGAIAIGDSAAVGEGSSAFGDSSAESGGFAANSSAASGAGSSAMGESTASGTNATAMGGSNVEGAGSTGVGGSTIFGSYSFAAGARATITNNNTFLWSDGSTNTVSTKNNQFIARASGGFILYSGAADTGVSLAHGSGSWSTMSDRDAKHEFTPVDPETILARVASLPMTSWSYKTEPGVRHIGPMAQDFYSAFNVGEDDKHIANVDEAGVALAAIQGLNQELKQRDAEIQQLKAQLEELQKLINSNIRGSLTTRR